MRRTARKGRRGRSRERRGLLPQRSWFERERRGKPRRRRFLAVEGQRRDAVRGRSTRGLLCRGASRGRRGRRWTAWNGQWRKLRVASMPACRRISMDNLFGVRKLPRWRSPRRLMVIELSCVAAGGRARSHRRVGIAWNTRAPEPLGRRRPVIDRGRVRDPGFVAVLMMRLLALLRLCRRIAVTGTTQLGYGSPSSDIEWPSRDRDWIVYRNTTRVWVQRWWRTRRTSLPRRGSSCGHSVLLCFLPLILK